MGVCERKNVTDVAGWHALDIPQDDDVTLRGGQCVDRLEDDLAGLSGQEFVLRRPPCRGLGGPMARPPWVSSRQKPRRIDRRRRLGREWDFTPLGAGPRTRQIDDDTEDPSPQRGATFVTVERA